MTRPGLHRHVHRHGDEPEHEHVHHHHAEEIRPAPRHERDAHTHGHDFERYAYLVSPVHALDPRAKVIATLAIVLAVVLSPPLRLPALLGLVALLLATGLLARLPLRYLLGRSLLVLPFAGAIALFAPLQHSGGSLSAGGIAGAYASGWTIAYGIISKAWLSVLAVVLLSATTPTPKLVKGLAALHVPKVMLSLLSFMYRYIGLLRAQISSARNALDSRGFALGRWERVRLYGNLAGNLFIRAYERGERVYAAMASRGYDGTLPTSETLRFGAPDTLLLVLTALAIAALLLY